MGSRIDGGRSTLLPLPAGGQSCCPGQGKGMAAVNPAAAHCGRRPFFALGKAREWRRSTLPLPAAGQSCCPLRPPAVLCPGQGKGME